MVHFPASYVRKNPSVLQNCLRKNDHKSTSTTSIPLPEATASGSPVNPTFAFFWNGSVAPVDDRRQRQPHALPKSLEGFEGACTTTSTCGKVYPFKGVACYGALRENGMNNIGR